MDVAAKTGTTNDEYDRWLCGFTPYYTATTWFGFDKNETIRFNKKNPSGLIWSNVMKRIHTGLDDAKFDVPKSKDLVSVQICKDTGFISNDACSNTYIEYYLAGTEIREYCTKHSGKKVNKTPEEKKTVENTNIKEEPVVQQPTVPNVPTTPEQPPVQDNTSSTTENPEDTIIPNITENTVPDNTVIEDNENVDENQDLSIEDIDDEFEQ